jgi:hypothetical protein
VWPLWVDLSGQLLLMVSSSVSFKSCSFQTNSSSNFIGCSCAISQVIPQCQKSFIPIINVYTLFFNSQNRSSTYINKYRNDNHIELHKQTWKLPVPILWCGLRNPSQRKSICPAQTAEWQLIILIGFYASSDVIAVQWIANCYT